MSWEVLSALLVRFELSSDEQGKVQLGRLDEEEFLRWYTRLAGFSLHSGIEDQDPNKLGRAIDQGWVEYINVQLSTLKHGGIGTEEFESKMRRLEERMGDNMALGTYAATIQKSDEVPLASETYLKLAKQHALDGGKRTPSYEEDGRFAEAMLDGFKDKTFWEMDVAVLSFVPTWADAFLNDRDPCELQGLINISDVSVLAWDTLKMICRKVADERAGGLAGEPEECLPYELLVWNLMVNHGHAERPDEGPTLSHRPEKLGYKIRDNEIRHTVDLLVQVGLTKTDARELVADAVGREFSTIQRICRKPYSLYGDLHLEEIKHMDPTYYSLVFGSDTNSDHSFSTRVGSRRSS